MDAPTVAVVAGAEEISRADLARVCAALETQIQRDLRPAWDVSARVVAVPYGEHPPTGAWPVSVLDELDQPGALAYHFLDGDLPTARVQHTDGWPLAASHQVLEMLVAPDNERFARAPSPKTSEGEVEVLVQVCDPCGMASAYEVQGVTVANFVLPAYYEAAGTGPLRPPRADQAPARGARGRLPELARAWPALVRRIMDCLEHEVHWPFPGEDWPDGDPLQILYHEVEPRLDPAVRARLDDDQDDLEGLLLYRATLEPEALASVRAYTVNFNPAVESELRRARVPVVEEVATNGAADQAGRNRTAVP